MTRREPNEERGAGSREREGQHAPCLQIRQALSSTWSSVSSLSVSLLPRWPRSPGCLQMPTPRRQILQFLGRPSSSPASAPAPSFAAARDSICRSSSARLCRSYRLRTAPACRPVPSFSAILSHSPAAIWCPPRSFASTASCMSKSSSRCSQGIYSGGGPLLLAFPFDPPLPLPLPAAEWLALADCARVASLGLAPPLISCSHKHYVSKAHKESRPDCLCTYALLPLPSL